MYSFVLKEVKIVIEFNNVSKTYDNGTAALKNVSLKINDGEFVFVVGASGAGKSTFLKIIMREQVPNSGTVVINDYNLNKIKKRDIPKFRRTMGIVFQDFRLIPNMTVYDNVAFAMRVIGAKEREISKRVPYVLSLVGLTSKARQYPNQLSGGEQQRVALSRALVNNAGILIADEPTGNIDPEMSYEIVDLLNHINAHGTTVVMVTHEHELVRKFNHRVITIDNGEVVSDTAEAQAEAVSESVFESVVSDDDKNATKQELIEAAHQDIQASVDKIREEQASTAKIGDKPDTAYYIQPNIDKDLEDFMKNYGIESDDIGKETDVDYSAYLSDGGDAE